MDEAELVRLENKINEIQNTTIPGINKNIAEFASSNRRQIINDFAKKYGVASASDPIYHQPTAKLPSKIDQNALAKMKADLLVQQQTLNDELNAMQANPDYFDRVSKKGVASTGAQQIQKAQQKLANLNASIQNLNQAIADAKKYEDELTYQSKGVGNLVGVAKTYHNAAIARRRMINDLNNKAIDHAAKGEYQDYVDNRLQVVQLLNEELAYDDDLLKNTPHAPYRFDDRAKLEQMLHEAKNEQLDNAITDMHYLNDIRRRRERLMQHVNQPNTSLNEQMQHVFDAINLTTDIADHDRITNDAKKILEDQRHIIEQEIDDYLNPNITNKYINFNTFRNLQNALADVSGKLSQLKTFTDELEKYKNDLQNTPSIG
jgi:hypothetical protein